MPGVWCRSRSGRWTGWPRSSATAGSRAAICSPAASACWWRPTAFPASRRAACSRRPRPRPPARRTPPSSSRSISTAATTGSTRSCPLADPRYPQLRSRIGIDPATVLPLADTTSFGWHPSLAGLRELYDAGKVAVLPAVDYSHPDQSHFNSGGYWRSGIVGTGARSQRLARANAGCDRDARQPVAGHPRGLGPGPVAQRAPRAGRDGLVALGLRLLHPGRVGGEGLPPDLPPALAGPRQAPGAGRRALDVRQHDRDARPPRAPGQGGQAGSAAPALPGHASRQGARQPRAHARRGFRHARGGRLERRLRHPRRAGRRSTPGCCRTWATRCGPGRPTSTCAASRSAC